MSVKVKIPTPLRGLTAGAGEVSAEGATVAEVLEHLGRHYPGLKERLCDSDGELRRFVNVYLDGEDIRFLDGLHTAVRAGADLSVVPAIAGG